MKNKSLAGIAFGTALFYFTLAVICQSAEAQSANRFRLVHDTVIVVSMTAAGQGPFDFVLDTGTSTTIVDTDLARRLSLAPTDRMALATVAGTQTLQRATLSELSLGSARAEHVEALIEDLSQFRKLDPKIQGVVGQNFFSHFNYLLDYRARTITFEDAAELQDALTGERVPITQADNRMMLSSSIQSHDHPQVRFVLDSGANYIVLFQKSSGAREVQLVQTAFELQSGDPAAQKNMQTTMGRIHDLKVGSQDLRDVPVAVPPVSSTDRERPEDGLLPTSLFKSLYINNSSAFVVFDPGKPKKN